MVEATLLLMLSLNYVRKKLHILWVQPIIPADFVFIIKIMYPSEDKM